jgi:hypothetical protein
MEATEHNTRPAITSEMMDQFLAFGVTHIYPVTITTDIKTTLGNVLAFAGELTWGGFDGHASGSVMIWTPNHYAGCKSSSVMYGAQVDFDRGPTELRTMWTSA